jgi:hypothetical protein
MKVTYVEFELNFKSRSSHNIYLILREFKQMIVRDHLYNIFNWISDWITQSLSGQVHLINSLSQLYTQIRTNNLT